MCLLIYILKHTNKMILLKKTIVYSRKMIMILVVFINVTITPSYSPLFEWGGGNLLSNFLLIFSFS